MLWKDFFYYSRSERRAIFFLLLLLAALTGSYWALDGNGPSVPVWEREESAEIDSFLAHLQQMDTVRSPRYVQRSRSTTDVPQPPRRGDVRKKAGVAWGKKKDAAVSPDSVSPVRTDFYPRQVKYAAGTVIDLNRCDTNELKKIPGIGSYRASVIVAYRQRLGGFANVRQLQETGKIDTAFNRWFSVDSAVVLRKLSVNSDGLERLRRHPYMNFSKAKALIDYRRRVGKIKHLSQLSLLKEFTEKDVEKLSPYLSFD